MPLSIYSILCRAGTMDNYSYLVIDGDTGTSAIIDPSEVAPIIKTCNEQHVKPDYILNTHHHFDHTDGNEELKKHYSLKIIGAEDRIPGIDIKLKDGDTWDLGRSKAQIIDVSAHTQGHILWYFAAVHPSPFKERQRSLAAKPLSEVERSATEQETNSNLSQGALFTGDTLFNLCIGGLFEGTPEEMFVALKKIKSLPDDTNFYPGHEYTMHCAHEAIAFNPSQDTVDYLTRAKHRLAQGLPVHPVTLGIEKKVNPYLAASTLEIFKKI